MDMDYLSDPIFADFGRSDFIGGIDNEALDFGPLEPFDNIDESNNNNSRSSCDNTTLVCDPKTEAPTTPPSSSTATEANTNISIATVSARVSLSSLSSTPIATPLPATAAIINIQATPHLPESPPDSGSEPPYSPLQDVHGLTLTSRDIYNGLPAIHQQVPPAPLHGIHHHMQPQFTPPHQSQHSTHFPHNLHTTHLNSSQQHGIGMQDNPNSSVIRVKHEAGLIMNASNLSQHMTNHNHPLNSHHNPNDAHIEMPPTLPLMYSANGHTNNNLMNSHHYDGVSGGSLYPAAASYPNVAVVGVSEPTTPTCTYLNDVPRGAQLVGTTQSNHALLVRTSAPSTPVHQATSRKRKLSTQLDFSEYQIKPDPGLTPLSPVAVGSSISPMAAAEPHQHLGPTSPVSINLPAHHQDTTSTTPAHSAASLSPALSTVNSNPDTSMDGNAGCLNSENGDPNALTPCITFSPFQPQNWHKLCDQSLQELPVGYYRVDADKGFNFSVSDDAYVCQKKNHFQITCHARLQGDAKFVKTPSGLEKIKYFRLHFYGVKLEAPNQTIRVEQSQSDRSKRPFHPVPIDLQSHIVSKITVCRLHFSETTNNNMRKKGRPNPEQRYFQLVVGLHVYTMSGNFPVISQGSERIIVRASNPGQFESDVELCWQRGLTQDSIFHMGRVGINCDRPDESLVVHGNIKVSGHIVQPSDSRAKHEIGELDTSVQLRNLLKIRIVRYRYEPEFALHSGLRRNSESESEDIVDTGVIAQEVREIIPDAVKEGGSIVLPNGNVIENFLLVNKDRILMENIGAVKELCKVTGSLENRIEHLESVNNRLIREKNFKGAGGFRGKSGSVRDGYEMCSNRTLQIIIFFLVIVMAACLAAVSTLYFIEHNKQDHHSKNVEFLQALMHPNYTHSTHNGHANIHGLYKMNDHLILPFGTSSSRPHGRNSSKPRLELLQYNDNGRSDETSAVMEKPVITLHQQVRTESKFTTSAPVQRNNKTSNSKNKLKWPSVEALVNRNIATVASAALAAHASNSQQQQQQQPQQQHHENDSNFNIAPPLDIVPELETEESLNASETSSEKVADSIPQHDIDNNSIDSDAQHVIKKAAPNKASSSLSDAAAKHKPDKNGDPDIQLQLTTDNTELNGANGQNGNALVYKTVSPPTSTLALTTNKISADNVNNSVDNSLSNRVGRRSPSRSQPQRSVEWVTERTVHVATFGRPPQCTQKLLHDSVSNCQSVCFEESNQLPPIHQPKLPAEQVGSKPINENHQNVDNVDTEDSDDADASLELDEGHSNSEIHSVNSSANSTRIAIGKSSHATQANAKQVPFEQQPEDIDNLEPLPKHSLSEEHFGDKAIAFTSIEVQHPPVSDCWQISSCIRADSLNQTFEAERFCPSSGKSLNITYVIPLSRFFKAPTIELRLSSSLHLQWTTCNSQEYTKRNGAPLVSSPAHHHHQQEQQQSSASNQRQQNTSIYFLNIPSRGYFASDIALRATTDSERQNICEESAHEANTLLQYNFRIVRDCDK